MKLDKAPTANDLLPKLNRLFELAAPKLLDLQRTWDPQRGTPVFTVQGRYTTRGWTEWTRGFQYGCQLLQFDATEDPQFLDLARDNIARHMSDHLTHTGVHDHGFNNISTYGNLRRLMREGRIDASDGQMQALHIALKVSGAVQAHRWTAIPATGDDRRELGFVHSFNGPHSLFVDTIRSMRSLALGWQLGQRLLGEQDQQIDLLTRSVQHGLATADYNVYYGEGRDIYDTPTEAGRVAHESIFNIRNGTYRCPSTQQGYSAFSTWTRGLAWALCGYPEQLEFLDEVNDGNLETVGGKAEIVERYKRAAIATADWYIRHSFTDGMVYWDGGAPALPTDLDYNAGPSDPYNDQEPIDSSAAAIAGQGLLRLGNYLTKHGDTEAGERYRKAAFTVASTLFDEPYLSTDTEHQGLILHSIYHRPRGWDHVPAGQSVPCGESSLWGDYHAMELGLMLKREAEGAPYFTFFS